MENDNTQDQVLENEEKKVEEVVVPVKITKLHLCAFGPTRESPTINELSEVMGSSHENVKQIL